MEIVGTNMKVSKVNEDRSPIYHRSVTMYYDMNDKQLWFRPISIYLNGEDSSAHLDDVISAPPSPSLSVKGLSPTQIRTRKRSARKSKSVK